MQEKEAEKNRPVDEMKRNGGKEGDTRDED